MKSHFRLLRIWRYEEYEKEILRLEHIDCIVSGKHLLSDLSLNVYEHEALCILGMKNAGKTLLVDYLTGEASIAGGQVYFNDVKIENPVNLKHKNMAVSRITKRHISDY